MNYNELEQRGPLKNEFIDRQCLINNIIYLTKKSGWLHSEGKISINSVDLVRYGDEVITESDLPGKAIATKEVIEEFSEIQNEWFGERPDQSKSRNFPEILFDDNDMLFGDIKDNDISDDDGNI